MIFKISNLIGLNDKRPYITALDDEPVYKVIEKMAKNDAESAIVIRKNLPVGIFTQKDVINISFDLENVKERPILEFATKNIITINKNKTILEALSLMFENNIRRVVVVDDFQRVLDVLSEKDIMGNIDDESIFKKDKSIKDIIRTKKEIFYLNKESSIKDAISLMKEKNIRSVLVEDNGLIKGIITEKDILKALGKNGVRSLFSTKIESIMSSPVIFVNANYSLINARNLMKEKNIRRIVIVNENKDKEEELKINEIIGILTYRDVLREIEEGKASILELKLKQTRAILDLLNESVFEILDEGNYKENTVIWVNKAAKENFNWAIGKNPINIFGKDVWHNIYEILEENQNISLDKAKINDRYYSISGIYIKDIGNLAKGRIKLILKDITKEVKLEKEVKGINYLYKSILDSMRDLIIIYDSQDYSIKYVNKATCLTLGYEYEELIGMNFFEIVVNDESKIKENIEKIIRERKIVEGRRLYKKKNGELIPVEVIASIFSLSKKKFDNGTLNFLKNFRDNDIFITARDITEKLIIEESLKEANRDLEKIHSFVKTLSRTIDEDEAFDILGYYLKTFNVDEIHVYRLNNSLNKIITSYILIDNKIAKNHISHYWNDDCLISDFSKCKVINSFPELVVNDIKTEYGCPYINVKESIKSFMCINITSNNVPIGIISLLSKEPSFFKGKTIENIHNIMNIFIPFLSNIRLFKINKELSIRDSLTGIYNRRFLSEFLEKEIIRTIRKDERLSIIIFDIDNFKKFNDTYGHRAGDIALKKICDVVSEKIRKSDIFARYGGEEFVIVLPETPKKEAIEISERIREAISLTPIDIKLSNEEKRVFLSASFGIATLPEDGLTEEALFLKADERLYKAKKEGKNKLVFS